jgi:hypothetical protein
MLSLLAIVVTATTVNAAPAAPQGDPGTGTAVTPDGSPPAMAAPAPVRDDAHGAPAPPSPAAGPPAATGAASETDAATTLERALAAYEYGDMDLVVEAARPVAEGRAHPSDTQRVQALRLLGIGLFLTGRREGAETAFFDLLRQKPGVHLDPTHTRPDVVAFFENVRTRHSAEIREAARSRPGGKHLAWAFLPPVGQFQNGDRGRGVIFGALEVISLGLAIGTYAQLKHWQHTADDTFPGHPEAHTLKIVNNISVGVFAATVIVGIVDGLVGFSAHDDEPPLAWIGPGGLTLRF